MDNVKCRVKDAGTVLLDPRTFCPVQDMVLEVRIEWAAQQDGLHTAEERKNRLEQKIGETVYESLEAAHLATQAKIAQKRAEEAEKRIN